MMGRPLGIDFPWILVDVGGQNGAKLGGKINKKSIQQLIKIIAILIIKETEKLLAKINDFYPLQHSYKKEIVFEKACI